MVNILAAKNLFLEFALSSWKRNETRQAKRRLVSELEMELNVAERLLDNLAKNRNTNIRMLFKLNKKIEELKNNVTSIKQGL